MTILLTGSTGQVGWELERSLLPLGKVVSPVRAELDLNRPESVAGVVDAVRPTAIVNPAAYTAVDRAESEPDRAFVVNRDAAGELAKAAKRHGALMLHYSTDYVFDGRKADAYTEDDRTAPMSVYARSKLAGEDAVRASGADHVILRTSWVYSARGSNFLKTMLRLAAERQELRVVSDQIGAPTWARLIAEATALILQKDLARRKQGNFLGGIFNLTASGETSWHGFATAIVENARKRGVGLCCREIKPITTPEYPLPAARPANSRLDGTRLASSYELQLPHWQRGLELCLNEMFPQTTTG